MKKLIALAVVAVMMFAMGASAFALVADSPSAMQDPPVFLSGMQVSDAWMSGLTAQNWSGALTQQAYAAGNYIWFIVKISVAAPGSTVAEHLWTGNGEEATLTITSKDNGLNLASANMATLAKLNGMSVTARQITNNNLNVVEALANKATFTFRSANADTWESWGGDPTLVFNDNNLALLWLDGIYRANTYRPDEGLAATITHRATAQKDFYLHFMAIVNNPTEGVCMASLKVNGEDKFVREAENGIIPPYTGYGQIGSPTEYTSFGEWYNWATWTSGTHSQNSQTYWDTSDNVNQLLPGDRSVPIILYNTYNNIEYAVAKINGKAYISNAPANNPYTDWRGPFSNGGSIYLVMSKDCKTFKVGFAVDGSFSGLVSWNKDYRGGTNKMDDRQGGAAGDFDFFGNPKTWNAAYYQALMSNDLSGGAAPNLITGYHGQTMGTNELAAIFDFFGFAYANPRAPGDADFLAKSGLVTTAEAPFNVANAVVTTPDTSVVIPQTGDATASTGLILIASAILAAAAVGFILSKRAYN